MWTHHDGRKSLLIGATAGEIVGLDAQSSRTVLDGILAWATQPEFVLHHRWTVGDLVVWDNPGLLHRAMPYSRPRVGSCAAPHWSVTRPSRDPTAGMGQGAHRDRHRRRVGHRIRHRAAIGNEGAAIAVFDLEAGAATTAAEKIASGGSRAVGFAVDVTDRARIDDAVAEVAETMCAPTVLVNSAGQDDFQPSTSPPRAGNRSSRSISPASSTVVRPWRRT